MSTSSLGLFRNSATVDIVVEKIPTHSRTLYFGGSTDVILRDSKN